MAELTSFGGSARLAWGLFRRSTPGPEATPAVPRTTAAP